MGDLTVDVHWFRKHMQQWASFKADMERAELLTDGNGADLPKMHPRMPDALQSVVPKLNAARTQAAANFGAGAKAAGDFQELLHQTAISYINREASGQAEIAELTKELES